MTEASQDRIIILHSHTDEKPFLKEFLEHLKPLARTGVGVWSDKSIAPGANWHNEIRTAIVNARVAVLMVSRSFLASDFINEHELLPILKEAAAGGVRILWIPVRASNYEVTPLKNYHAVLSPEKPLAQMKAERDTAWVLICKEIMSALQSVAETYVATESPKKPQENTAKFTAIIDRLEIAQAFKHFAQAVKNGSQPLSRMLGWQGSSTSAKVYWHAKYSLWVAVDPEGFVENRYWNAFGIDDPNKTQTLGITCEINFPRDGINRRVAGAFAKNAVGNTIVLHSGKVGGGRAGIGKNAFSAAYGRQEKWAVVQWPGSDYSTEHIAIGNVNDTQFIQEVAEFVHAVHTFKNEVSTR